MTKVNKTLWELREQYLAEDDPQLRLKIRQEYERLIDAIISLADKELGANTPKYVQATNDLSKANKALKKARRELKNIARAINKLAAAVDIIVEIVDTVS